MSGGGPRSRTCRSPAYPASSAAKSTAGANVRCEPRYRRAPPARTMSTQRPGLSKSDAGHHLIDRPHHRQHHPEEQRPQHQGGRRADEPLYPFRRVPYVALVEVADV